MSTIILDANIKENIELCAKEIIKGEIVAMPTETVYGLAANALDEAAVSKIFLTKGRQRDNPLIVHVSSARDVEGLVSDIPDCFYPLVENFWPGPLTLILKHNNLLPKVVTAGLDSVAIRMPNHKAALELIELSGCPLAAPSANISGSPSPTKAVHVRDDFDGKIKYILDGGDCTVGLESTVLDISQAVPKILRPGGVTFAKLVKVLGGVDVENLEDVQSPRSPGMKYRHYAPMAPLIALSGAPEESVRYIREHLDDNTGALMFDDFAVVHQNVISYGRYDDHETQGVNLFDALRRFDDMAVTQIYAQLPSEVGLGFAIANRIKKAAGNKIVTV